MQPKKLHTLEVFSPASIGGGSIWHLATTDRLDHVLQPLYLNRFAEHNLRKHDRIMVTANYNGDAETSWLLVTNVVPGKSIEAKQI
jgi:hypothetical protein